VPEISETSKQLALSKRERIIEHIKQSQPEIAKIDLCFLLNYQQNLSELDK
jgi:hypothetical protein